MVITKIIALMEGIHVKSTQGNYATGGSAIVAIAIVGERWMSRPFVHSGNLNFKHTLTNNLVFHNA